MEKSAVQAGFQLMDNYVSDFSLNVFEKIRMDANLGVNVNLGFAIVSINEKDLIGQIELRYDIDIINNEKEFTPGITTQYFNPQKVTDMKGKKNDYRAFLKKSGIKAREGKQVYISLANHSVITEITYLLGKGNLTIADYLDNVLNEHFQTHRAEINRMLDSVPKVEL